MLRIKICGLTTPQDAAKAIELGADALGFNFFPGSKRYLDSEGAAGWIADLPGEVAKIGILVNPSWEEAVSIAALPGITSLQLHGAESVEFCRQLRGRAIQFEKAVPADSPFVEIVEQYSTDTVLLDSGGLGQFGGSGRTFNWEIARDVIARYPSLNVVVAGGLTPEKLRALGGVHFGCARRVNRRRADCGRAVIAKGLVCFLLLPLPHSSTSHHLCLIALKPSSAPERQSYLP
jgi:phosphoribosylanthranilate isomerase